MHNVHAKGALLAAACVPALIWAAPAQSQERPVTARAITSGDVADLVRTAGENGREDGP